MTTQGRLGLPNATPATFVRLHKSTISPHLTSAAQSPGLVMPAGTIYGLRLSKRLPPPHGATPSARDLIPLPRRC